MIKTRIAIIIAVAMIGVIVNYVGIPKTLAGGGHYVVGCTAPKMYT